MIFPEKEGPRNYKNQFFFCKESKTRLGDRDQNDLRLVKPAPATLTIVIAGRRRRLAHKVRSANHTTGIQQWAARS